MTRRALMRWVLFAILVYLSYGALLTWFKFVDRFDELYVLLKDGAIFVSALPAAWLAACFQRRTSFLEQLRAREGTTILLTTHDMAEAERLCARIGFLAHGKLVAEGTADALKKLAGAQTLDDAFIKLTGEQLSDDESSEEELEVLEEV